MGRLEREHLISSKKYVARNMKLRDDGRPYCMGSYLNRKRNNQSEVTPCDINMPKEPFNFTDAFVENYIEELSENPDTETESDNSILDQILNGITSASQMISAGFNAEMDKLSEWQEANEINIDDYNLSGGRTNKCRIMLEADKHDSEYYSLML